MDNLRSCVAILMWNVCDRGTLQD